MNNFLIKIGEGFDVHRLVENRPLILGGVHIPFEKGLLGHSDADALIHAIIDALLGAAALGDIGTHFPDTDPQFKNSNSADLLKETKKRIENFGFTIGNIDSTIIAQKPKLRDFILPMRENIANILQIPLNCMNVKAKTNEKLGYLGNSDAIQTHAITLLFTQNPRWTACFFEKKSWFTVDF